MIDWEERETDYIDWEVKYGKEEAILIASEEWGISTYQVKLKVEEWDNSCLLYTSDAADDA